MTQKKKIAVLSAGSETFIGYIEAADEEKICNQQLSGIKLVNAWRIVSIPTQTQYGIAVQTQLLPTHLQKGPTDELSINACYGYVPKDQEAYQAAMDAMADAVSEAPPGQSVLRPNMANPKINDLLRKN